MAVCGPPIADLDVKGFYTLSCPRGAPKEFEARGNTGVVREASNVNLFGQELPTVERNQFGQELFQGDAMKRIVGLDFIHGQDLGTGSMKRQYCFGHGVSRLIKLVGIGFC